MDFRPAVFFDGFTRYLQEQRANVLQFLAATASFESWIQFEAGAWIHEHREMLGLSAHECTINLELKKTDLWLHDKGDSSNITIEFKCFHNNKNCRGKVRELRRDLSNAKALPTGSSNDNTTRFGLAILTYLRYQRGWEGCYQVLGGKLRPYSLERFLDYFRVECASTDNWFGSLPTLRLCSEVVQIVSLAAGIGIDSTCPGSSVWLALTTLKNVQYPVIS